MYRRVFRQPLSGFYEYVNPFSWAHVGDTPNNKGIRGDVEPGQVSGLIPVPGKIMAFVNSDHLFTGNA